MDTAALKELIESQITDVKESVKTAYTSMEKRLEGMNEFRDQLKDQASRFITREELEARFSTTDLKIQNIQRIIYIGIGIIITLEFAIPLFLRYYTK